jgi:carbonic anhydrase/acetyltransferase-like protein (isoleucine patch superfamily)
MSKKPEIDKTSYIHPSATIIGKVTIGKSCSVFPQAVIRADEHNITIGHGSNIQDCCVIHVDENHPVTIGNNVSLGHCAMVHGAAIEEDCIIGIHATVLSGAIIKKGSIIGANALVTQDTVIPENSLVLGVPGKVIKQDELYQKEAHKNAIIYQKLAQEYLDGKIKEYTK